MIVDFPFVSLFLSVYIKILAFKIKKTKEIILRKELLYILYELGQPGIHTGKGVTKRKLDS